MPTNLVHKYNPENNSWEIISHMRTARYWPLVAVLSGCELTVVGERLVVEHGQMQLKWCK